MADAAVDAVANAVANDPYLLIPKKNQDLSAYRLDCDVFGWNKSFTEVAAVGTEVRRGPLGKHRGEAFLLVYRVGETLPIHNVIAHTITHADLPHDPVDLDDARHLKWVVEGSFLHMWPKRPYHRRPSGAMRVEPLWDFLPDAPEASHLCQPAVAFMLSYQGQRRFQPYQSLDMHAPCARLRHTDTRLYWGTKDRAAAMIRFDFSADAREKSARFVVSAAWSLARSVRLHVQYTRPLDPCFKRTLETALKKYGTVVFKIKRSYNKAHPDQTPSDASSDASDSPSSVESIRVAAAASFSVLAERVGRELHANRVGALTWPAKADIVIDIGDTVLKPKPSKPHPAVPTAPVAPPSLDATYIKNWTPP